MDERQKDRQIDCRKDREKDRQNAEGGGEREEYRDGRISMGWDGMYMSDELSVMIGIFLFPLLRIMMMEEHRVGTCRDDRQR